jgi:hypothetical protein
MLLVRFMKISEMLAILTIIYMMMTMIVMIGGCSEDQPEETETINNSECLEYDITLWFACR